MSGLPRYLAAARIEEPGRLVELADDLIGANAVGPVVLLQIGRPSIVAGEVARQFQRYGRSTLPLVVRDRDSAQADHTVARLAGASAAWVFADDMLEVFMVLYATELAFCLRSKARAGLPVMGTGGGALALGGLHLASRICDSTDYDLVGGLGWAARVFVDSSVVGYGGEDDSIAREAVTSLPGLLALQLGDAGAVRVEGGRIESIGSEPILLLGANGDGSLMMLEVAPGDRATIAPPPFAPFETGLLPPATLRALTAQVSVKASTMAPLVAPPAASTKPRPVATRRPAPLRQAPQPVDRQADVVTTDTQERPGGGRYCAMCKKVHGGAPKLELAA